MTFTRWSLYQVVAGIGTAAIFVLFVPMGLYFRHSLVSTSERRLLARGRSIAETLAGQIVDAVLLEDRLALNGILQTAASTHGDVRYLCMEGSDGRVLAHTFADGCPQALVSLWRDHNGRSAVRFRTSDEPMVDVSAPVLAGQLGTLHVGLSRAAVVGAARRTMWVTGPALAAAIAIVLVGAHLVAASVSHPLRQLHTAISRLPEQHQHDDLSGLSGTREVEALAEGFADMAMRLETLEHERTVAHQRMIHSERLAALGQLAAGLAHEIHNPLDGMLECVRYLEANAEKDERTAKYLPMLKDGLERITAVMRHTLEFARSGSEPSIEPFAVTDIMESLGLMLESRLDAGNVRLTIEAPGPCFCLCSRQGLSQAVLNLALNGAEAAASSARPEVRIHAECDTQWVYVFVEDSGQGVPEELRESIFDPFVTTQPAGKGTGLGLSISRELVRATGGDLELSPEPSELGGARFVIRLPIARERGHSDE